MLRSWWRSARKINFPFSLNFSISSVHLLPAQSPWFWLLFFWFYGTIIPWPFQSPFSFLRVNGLRNRGWWQAHHFILTSTGDVLLVWPDREYFHTSIDTHQHVPWILLYGWVSLYMYSISIFLSCIQKITKD